jgi:predicted nucleotidyltransferase
MTAINAMQAQALRTLVALWPEEQMVIIGASAVSCFIEMKRMTFDIDLSVSLTLENYEEDLKKLDRWPPDPNKEGRWNAPDNVMVDIIPAGPSLLAKGHFTWPRSGRTMRLIGIRLAFAHAVAIHVEKDLQIRVAPLPVLTVLKMAAYVDRPSERERDLGDIALIMNAFVSEEHHFSDDIIDLGLEYPDISPYLLGAEIALLVNEEERTAINQFLSMARDEEHPTATLARMARTSPAEFQDPSRLSRGLEVFEQGLRAMLKNS